MDHVRPPRYRPALPRHIGAGANTGENAPTFGSVMADIGRVLAVILSLVVAANASASLFGWR